MSQVSRVTRNRCEGECAIAVDEGQIFVGGLDVRRQLTAAKRLMGVVPQDIALYPTLSARENLMFWGKMYGLGGRELALRVDEALEIVSLTDRQRERVDTYSGGMKRRINVAAALLHRPELLIMDEPTVGIDPQSRNHILETVRRLARDQGMTVLYTSHYMAEVEYLCQRVAIIDHGRVIAGGSLEEVRRLAGPDTAVRLRVAQPDPALVGALVGAVAGVPGVRRVLEAEDALVVMVSDTAATLAPVLAAVGDAGGGGRSGQQFSFPAGIYGPQWRKNPEGSGSGHGSIESIAGRPAHCGRDCGSGRLRTGSGGWPRPGGPGGDAPREQSGSGRRPRAASGTGPCGRELPSCL